MIKFFLLILIIVLIGAAGYFAFSKQINEQFLGQNPASPSTVPVQVVQKVIPPTAAPTSSPEDDMTALEKDLSSLQSSDTGFAQEVNSL